MEPKHREAPVHASLRPIASAAKRVKSSRAITVPITGAITFEVKIGVVMRF